jgi:IS605 OrfB family transposase
MATSEQQQTLESFTAGTTTERVTQTVVVPLETSQRKNAVVKTAIDEFQAMCSYMAAMLPSFQPHDRSPQNPTLYRLLTRAFPADERTVAAKVALAASRHVAAAFESRRQRGDGGDRPTFGDGSYFRLDNQQLSIVENDRGYGLKANFIPYNPEWFHIHTRPYTRDYVTRIVDGDASYGTAEFHLHGDGSLRLHLPVSWDVEVYKPADVATRVGVDIGETVLYAAAVVCGDDIAAVEMESGREFRHYRERLQRKRDQLQQQDDLRGIKATRDDQRRYTEQVLDTASRAVVDLAVDHAPAVIQLEDLTHYRSSARDPIHDWPFADFQAKIAYKARARQIPVVVVDPAHTSITCRKCGQTNREYRSGSDFCCTRCGYEVHADVNAAINIAQATDTV